jgi:hypothetical protein
MDMAPEVHRLRRAHPEYEEQDPSQQGDFQDYCHAQAGTAQEGEDQAPGDAHLADIPQPEMSPLHPNTTPQPPATHRLSCKANRASCVFSGSRNLTSWNLAMISKSRSTVAHPQSPSDPWDKDLAVPEDGIQHQ